MRKDKKYYIYTGLKHLQKKYHGKRFILKSDNGNY